MKCFLFFLILVVSFLACNTSNSENSYDDLTNQGWVYFSKHKYSRAIKEFNDAIEKSPERIDAYIGVCWSYMKTDCLNLSIQNFQIASTKSLVDADLFAGWAYALNAKKDYANSSIKASDALAIDTFWVFTKSNSLSLTHVDLHILKAENFFLLGFFQQSLNEVKIVNATFPIVSVNSDLEKSELAKEIQRLKSL